MPPRPRRPQPYKPTQHLNAEFIRREYARLLAIALQMKHPESQYDFLSFYHMIHVSTKYNSAEHQYTVGIYFLNPDSGPMTLQKQLNNIPRADFDLTTEEFGQKHFPNLAAYEARRKKIGGF